jgi:hypothetical protein
MIAKPKPKKSNKKFFMPFISLYKNIAQRFETIDGPALNNGKDTAGLNAFNDKKNNKLPTPNISP